MCAAYKWLLGPYGVSFLYVAPRHHGGQPIEDNPGGREFNFKSGWMSQYLNSGQNYHPDARRFEQGQADVFNAIPQTAVSIEQVLTWGVPNIYATLSALTETISKRAAELGLSCVPTRRHGGHIVGIEFADGIAERVLKDLKHEGIYVERLDDFLRLSPHLYNTAEDIDRFFTVVETSIKGRGSGS